MHIARNLEGQTASVTVYILMVGILAPGPLGRRKGEFFSGYRLSVLQAEKVLEEYCANVYIWLTLGVYI